MLLPECPFLDSVCIVCCLEESKKRAKRPIVWSTKSIGTHELSTFFQSFIHSFSAYAIPCLYKTLILFVVISVVVVVCVKEGGGGLKGKSVFGWVAEKREERQEWGGTQQGPSPLTPGFFLCYLPLLPNVAGIFFLVSVLQEAHCLPSFAHVVPQPQLAMLFLSFLSFYSFRSVLSISSNQMSSFFVMARGRGGLFCCCRPSKHELLCSLLAMEEGRCCSISWSLFWSPRWGKNWTEMDGFLFFFVPENTRKIEERKAFSLLKKEWRLWCLCVCSLSHLWFTVYACVFVMMEEVSQAKSTTHRPPFLSFLSFLPFCFQKRKGKNKARGRIELSTSCLLDRRNNHYATEP